MQKIQQNSLPIHDLKKNKNKNSQQARNKGEHHRLDKEHLQKIYSQPHT